MVTVRKTGARDAERLPDIERSAARAFLALPDLAWIAGDDVQPAERHRELIAGGHAWVAVDSDDAPVGFLAAEKLDDTLHVWELAVRHDWQRRGIGRALLARAVEAARAEGLAAVTLTTFRDVAWNEPFYRRFGFRILAADAVPRHLKKVLEAEAAHGLPPGRRCAMALTLAGRRMDAVRRRIASGPQTAFSGA